MSEDDQDWFAISTAGPDTIHLSFYAKMRNDYYGRYNVDVEDSEGNTLLSFSQNSYFMEFNFGVKKEGIYFIKVFKGKYHTTDPYTLTATLTNDPPPISDCSQEQLQLAYQNGYQAGIDECSNGACAPATLSSELNMHIPEIQYNTPFGVMNLWVDLQFAGEKDGEMLWKLSDFEEN